MKNGSRLAALGGVVVAGVLALSACGSDANEGATAAPTGDIDCATGTVNVAGSSAQKNAMEEWTKAYAKACDGATINYNPTGSGAGIQAFTQGQVAFAGSDSALDPDDGEIAAATKRCQGNAPVHLPMVVGPVAVVYNVEGVQGLQLSPATLAKAMSGKIKKWNDPAIAAENEGANLPATDIKPVYRADESGTTDNFTNYLNTVAGDVWTWEHAKKWPAKAGQGANGSDGVTQLVKSTAGAISYVEMSFADNNKLAKAKIKNGAGEFTELTADSASKAVAGAKVVGTGNDIELEIDYATKQSGAYPIVLVTYEIPCSKGLPKEQADFVKSFLTYTSSADGQKILTDIGYAPLPTPVLSKVQASVKALS